MPTSLKDQVLESLKSVIDPKIAAVQDIRAAEGEVYVTLDVDPAAGAALEPMRQAAETALEKISGVKSARVVLTAEKKAPPAMSVKGPQKNQFSHKISSLPVAPDVKHMIAVASGKGGVGKSTVSANLALALARMGKSVGLLDADIYGSSQPRMMGVLEKPATDDKGMILPLDAHGIKVMSMGFFVDAEAPVIWRGPMVHSAIQQLLRDVAWGNLDVLIIDLPPGTGDAQLSLAQYVPLSGAVIVSTPQDVALSEAKKGLRMFEKTNVPVLGMIENMSYHECTACGHREHVFSHGGVREAAEKIGVDFLGEIPLLTAIRERADTGAPIVASDHKHPASEIFMNIAARIWMKLPVERQMRGAG